MQEEKHSSGDGIVLPPGGGKVIQVLGNPWTIKAGREDTGGPIAVLEGPALRKTPWSRKVDKCGTVFA